MLSRFTSVFAFLLLLSNVWAACNNNFSPWILVGQKLAHNAPADLPDYAALIVDNHSNGIYQLGTKPSGTAANAGLTIQYVGKGSNAQCRGVRQRFNAHRTTPEGAIVRNWAHPTMPVGTCVFLRVKYCSDAPGRSDAAIQEAQLIADIGLGALRWNGQEGNAAVAPPACVVPANPANTDAQHPACPALA